MMRSFPLWTVLFFSLFFTLGCPDNDGPGTGQDCNRTSDCPEDWRCNADFKCSVESQACEFSSECAIDEYCAEGQCALSGCTDDETCVDGTICEGDVCVSGCRVDEDCPAGEACSVTNLCQPSGCTTSTCPAFQECNTDLDPATCQYNGDCDSNAQCVGYAEVVGDGEEYFCSTAQQKCLIKPPCGGDEDCKQNEICEPRQRDGRQVCRVGCRGNNDCSAGRICEPNNLLCVRGCNTDNDCDPVGGVEYACVELFCIPTCETRSDCAVQGQVCNGDPQTCKGCSSDSQCPATQFCDFTKGATPEEEANPVVGLCEDLPPACPDDGYGENHTENTPYDLTTFPYMTPVDMVPLLCRDKPAGEWYRVAVGSGEVIEVELQYSNNDGNMDLALRREGGAELVASAKPPTGDDPDNGTEIIRYGVELGGNFLIQVRGTLVNQNAEYNLRVDVAPPPACMADMFEPNDVNAPALLPSDTDYQDLQVCGDDADFYELAIGQNQVVTITTQAPSNLGNIDLFLRDDAGITVASATTGMDVERIDIAIDTAGSYFLEVRVVGGVGAVDYALEWRQADNDCADPFEANDTCPSGAPLGAGLQQSLNVCDDGDWYQITLAPLQTITVTATYDRAIAAGDLDTSLFGPNDCATLVAAGTETSIPNTSLVEEVLTYQAAQGGIFNLQTFLFAGVQAGYDLDIDIQDGPPCVDDASEPNNTTATGSTINRAQAAIGDDNIATGLKICDNDSDFFQIDLLDGDVIQWQVSFQHNLGDIDAELIGPDGSTVLDLGNTTTDNETVTYTVGAGEAGTYYLRVFGKFATRTDYWVLTYLNGTGPVDPVCPDDQENNDSRVEAATVAPGNYGLLVCGNPRDDDWFKTTVNPGDQITIDLTFQHAAGNIDLFVFDDSGSPSTVAQSISNSDNESATYTSARQQEVFWQVRTGGSVVNQPYGMNVTVTPGAACPGDDYDPNGSAATATPAPAPGLIGRLQLCENTEDWFEVDLVAGQDAEAFINFNGQAADLDLYVYEPDGSTLVGSGTSTTSDESVLFTPSLTGTHYVRVAHKSPARLDYDLMMYVDTDNDTVLEGPEDRVCPDFAENNDVRANAAEIPVGTYDDLLLCWQGGVNNDDDYYSVFVPAGATVTARIDFTNAEGNLQLRLYRGTSLVVEDQSLTTADFEEVTATNAGNGENYIIYVFGGVTGFSSYYSLDVGLSFADACTEDADSGPTLGSAPLRTAGVYENMLCEGTEDWIQIPTGTSSLTANIELKNRLGNIDVELWVGGAPVASSVSNGNIESIDMAGLGAGAKYLRIFPRDGGFLRNAYDLWLQLDANTPSEPYCPDPYERDDEQSAAETFAITTTPYYPDPIACGTDVDYFLVTGLFLNSTYELGVFYDHAAQSDLELEILDSTGTSLMVVDTATNDALTAFTAPATGSYYFVVRNNGTAETPYDLLMARDTIYLNNCIDDGFEPNDNAFSAATVTIPFDEGLGACGNDDYFKFTAPSTGNLTISAKFDQSKMDIGMFVVRVSDNQTLAVVNNNMDNREETTVAVTAGTEYRVDIQRVGMTTGPYFLSIE